MREKIEFLFLTILETITRMRINTIFTCNTERSIGIRIRKSGTRRKNDGVVKWNQISRKRKAVGKGGEISKERVGEVGAKVEEHFMKITFK